MVWRILGGGWGGSDELIDEAVAGFGMAIVGGGQFVEKLGDGAIMDWRGHAVDADGQGAGGVVGL